MLYKEKNIIVGYSGHSYVVIDAALELGLDVYGYSEKSSVKNNPFNLEYIGFEGDSNFKGFNLGNRFILGIGDNFLRSKVYAHFEDRREQVISIIHPASRIGRATKIGVGSFISSGSHINTLSWVGKGCIINTGAIVEHECVVENFVHIGPGAVLAGNVTIGTQSFIGANSVIKQGVKIGSNVMVGAGSVVLYDVPSNTTVVGNPSRKLL